MEELSFRRKASERDHDASLLEEVLIAYIEKDIRSLKSLHK
jgi:hypothetical protein